MESEGGDVDITLPMSGGPRRAAESTSASAEVAMLSKPPLAQTAIAAVARLRVTGMRALIVVGM